MKITQIGHGTLDNEHLVFCIVDFDKIVMSSVYKDKQEYGMYWFEEWTQNELNKPDNGAISFSNADILEKFSGYSAITRIEKPVKSIHHEYGGFGDIEMIPYTRTIKKVKRNEPCECGSGKKFKKCCL